LWAASATSFIRIFRSETLNPVSFIDLDKSIIDLRVQPGRMRPSRVGVTSSFSAGILSISLADMTLDHRFNCLGFTYEAEEKQYALLYLNFIITSFLVL
jgi:hypothetical protein